MSQEPGGGEVCRGAFADSRLVGRKKVSVACTDLHHSLNLFNGWNLVPVRALVIEGESGLIKEPAEVGTAGDKDPHVGGGWVAETVESHRRDVDGLTRHGKAPIESVRSLSRELGRAFQNEEGLLIGVTVRWGYDSGWNCGFEDTVLVVRFGIGKSPLEFDTEEFDLLGFIHVDSRSYF